MEGRLQPRTIKRYREIVDLHLVPTLGSVPLKKLQPAQVDRMLAAKHREGLSRRTRTYIRTSLGAAMELALKRGLVGRNVVRLTEPLAQRAAESVDRDWVAYTPEQARNLLEAGREDIDWPLWALALTTGARMGELLGLKWSDVDWERRELRIVRALERIGSSYRLKENKTPKSRRTVPLAAVAIEALKQQKAKQAAARLEAAEWSDAWGLVFTKASGAPRLDTAVHRHFQRRLQAYGLPVIRFHDLRHTHATQLLNAGIPVHEVSRRLGHASPTITLAVYAHAQPSMAAAITSAIDRLLT